MADAGHVRIPNGTSTELERKQQHTEGHHQRQRHDPGQQQQQHKQGFGQQDMPHGSTPKATSTAGEDKAVAEQSELQPHNTHAQDLGYEQDQLLHGSSVAAGAMPDALQQQQTQSVQQHQQQQPGRQHASGPDLPQQPQQQAQWKQAADKVDGEWERENPAQMGSSKGADAHKAQQQQQQQQQQHPMNPNHGAQQQIFQNQQQQMSVVLGPPAKRPGTNPYNEVHHRQEVAAAAVAATCSEGCDAAAMAPSVDGADSSAAAAAGGGVEPHYTPGAEAAGVSNPAVMSDSAAAATAVQPDSAAAAAAAEGVVVNLDCPSCQPGTAEHHAAKEAVDRTLAAYNKSLQRHHKQERSKPDMIAYSELRLQHTPPPVHGHIPGVVVGQQFSGRGELAVTGLHTAMMKGIMALRAAAKGGGVLPCFAIALSGGYKDDADTGSTFWYTGEGGQESKGGKQGRDQSYNSIGNAALLQSYTTQVPVRVFRSQPALKPDQAAKRAVKSWNPPRQMYEGLYRVKSHKMVVGTDGMLVCKFEMQAIPGHSVVSTKVEYRCLAKASFKKKQLAQPTTREPAAAKQKAEQEPRAGRKRGRDSEAAVKPPRGCKPKATAAATPLKLLTRTEVEVLIQQRAAAGSYGRLVTADIAAGLEKIPVAVFNAVDNDDRILMQYVQAAPATSAAAGPATAPRTATAAGHKDDTTAVDAGAAAPAQCSRSSAASSTGGDACSHAASGTGAVTPPAAVAAVVGGGVEDAAASDSSRQSSSTAAAAGGATCSTKGSSAADCCGCAAAAPAADIGGALAAAAAAATAAMDVDMEDAQPQFTYIADYPLEHDEAVHELIKAGEAAFKAKYKGTCGIRFQDSKANPGQEETFNELGLLVYTHPSGILECGEKCRQTELCKWNRVVSGGIRYPLEVFKVSAAKGWGVHPSVDLPTGAFVCCYIGLLRTDQQADKLMPGQDRYLFDLSHFHEMWDAQQQGRLEEPINSNLGQLQGELQEKHLVVDADRTGNVARFINHSCDPNCMIQAVLAGRARSQLLYYIAIVTQKHIKAGEELSYDYGEIYHSEVEVNGARFKFPCQCGAANCKGRIGSSTATAEAAAC